MIELLGIGMHDRLRTLLSSYVDGQVSPVEAARVESHLTSCDECQRDLDNMRATVGLLNAMPELELPRSFLLTAEPEPVRSSWAVQWGGALATAAAAAVFLALVAGDMTGVFEQTGLTVRDEAASVAATAVEAEMAVAADTAAAPTAASAAAEPESGPDVVPQVALESDLAEGSDDSAADDADTADTGAAVAMAAPAPEVASLEEPAAESAMAPQAATASEGSEDMMEGADLMPYAGSETAAVDTSIDVAKELRKAGPASDEPASAPAPALAAEAPVAGDDSQASDDAEPPELVLPTLAESANEAGDGEVDGDDAIELPLRQFQIAAGALLVLLLAATLVLTMRRRRAL